MEGLLKKKPTEEKLPRGIGSLKIDRFFKKSLLKTKTTSNGVFLVFLLLKVLSHVYNFYTEKQN